MKIVMLFFVTLFLIVCSAFCEQQPRSTVSTITSKKIVTRCDEVPFSVMQGIYDRYIM